MPMSGLGTGGAFDLGFSSAGIPHRANRVSSISMSAGSSLGGGNSPVRGGTTMNSVTLETAASIETNKRRQDTPIRAMGSDVVDLEDYDQVMIAVINDNKEVDDEYMKKNIKSNGPIAKAKELNEKRKVSNVLKYYNELFVKSQILERIIPRRVNNAQEFRDFNQYVLRSQKDYEETDIGAINDGLLDLIYDLLDRGGKRWRPVLGMIYAECYGRNVAESVEKGSSVDDDILFACGLTEFVHNGSLMVDDVEDKSLMRRG